MLQLLTSVSRMALLLLTLTPSSAGRSVDSVFGNPEKSLLEAEDLLKKGSLYHYLINLGRYGGQAMTHWFRVNLTHDYVPGRRG